MSGISQVTCPKCSYEFSVEDILVRDIEARVRSNFQQVQAAEEQCLAPRAKELSTMEAALRQMQSGVEKTVAERLSAEAPKLTEKLR